MRTFILALALAACGDDAPADTDTDATDTGAPSDTDTDVDTDTDADTDTDTDTDGLPIVGSYVDMWGIAHDITETAWSQTYPGYAADVYHVSAWDVGERWVVAQNDPANAFNGGAWSRFDWYDDGAGELYYCQAVFAGASEAEATAAPLSDATDLDAGCGGFGWTHLTP